MSSRLKIPVALLACALAALAALPWWLGLALRPVARAAGADFARYERDGYARFRLHGVTYRRDGLAITADRLESDSPLVWLGRRLRGSDPMLIADGWRVTGSPRAATSGPSAVTGPADLQALLGRVLPRVLFWVPRAVLTGGAVHGYGPDLVLAHADWDRSGLRATGLDVAGHVLDATLAFSDRELRLQAREPAQAATFELTARESILTGSLRWHGQEARFEAEFAERGWAPRTASVVAENWTLPAATVRLAPAYTTVESAANVTWRDGQWRLDIHAQAMPGATPEAPPFTLRAQAHGDLHGFTVETLHVDAPFAQARLSAPVTLDFTGPLPEQNARLNVEADLARLPWVSARGRVTGTVDASGSADGAQLAYALAFTNAAFGEWILPKADARGRLQWPHLVVDSLRADLGSGNGFDGSGRLDLAARVWEGVALHATATPDHYARWLPAGLTWETATLHATLEGPFAQPQHGGRASVTGFSYGPLQPLSADAEWRGTGATLADLSTQLRAGNSTLQLAGALDTAGAEIRELRLITTDRPTWALTAPARATWSPAWQVDALHLSGDDGRLHLRFATAPHVAFAVEADGIGSARLTDWVRLPGPAWHLEALRSEGRVQNGHLALDATLTASVALAPAQARLRLAMSADDAGLRIDELTVVEGQRELTRITGRLPFTARLDPAWHWQLDENAPLEFTASVDADSPLWALLAARAGIELNQPAADLALRGSLARPDGHLRLRAETIRNTGHADLPLPEITGLQLDAELRRDALTLTTLTARLDGQKAEGSGSLPMDDTRWRRLWSDPAALDWKSARGRLSLDDAELAVFARRLPQVLAPQGRIGAHLELDAGRWRGALRLAGGASRPLPPFGTLQDIHADLQLDDGTLTVTRLTGRLGGEQVDVAGAITRHAGDVWQPALTLRGKNLPLVRSPGLLLRTDLDLRTEPLDGGAVRVAGTVTVRDCLVLANLAALLPSGTRGATRTPPYFAVTTGPFREWPLAVELRGERAVRVRTALFEGTATPRFRLSGTLGEPRAVGQLAVDEGRALFPFAVFTVQQGTVLLSEADPYTPRINGRATARRHGYDLLLEASGTPAAPSLTFSSTPALDAADVLMMVTTGRPPESDTADLNTPQRLTRFGAFLGRGLIQELGFGGDRLEISTGEEVSRLGRETYRIEYRVNDRWYLTGEYDEYDHYNAGVRWRVHTVEGTPREDAR